MCLTRESTMCDKFEIYKIHIYENTERIFAPSFLCFQKVCIPTGARYRGLSNAPRTLTILLFFGGKLKSKILVQFCSGLSKKIFRRCSYGGELEKK